MSWNENHTFTICEIKNNFINCIIFHEIDSKCNISHIRTWKNIYGMYKWTPIGFIGSIYSICGKEIIVEIDSTEEAIICNVCCKSEEIE